MPMLLPMQTQRTQRASARHNLLRAAVIVGLLAGAAVPFSAQATHIQNDQATFKTVCKFSHSLSDDPIVRPGQPGGSHSHDFFANTTTNAHSTHELLRAGATTCQDPEDKSGYWLPSLTKNGVKVDPSAVGVYFSLDGKHPGQVKPFPAGLKVVAGDASARAPQDLAIVSWGCTGKETRTTSTTPPSSCPTGSTVQLRVKFPDCWDGRNLDSADHRSHMAYSAGGTQEVGRACPATHPVEQPSLELKFQYRSLQDGLDVQLSSGGVYSGHADFFNAWTPARLAERVDTCLNGVLVCK